MKIKLRYVWVSLLTFLLTFIQFGTLTQNSMALGIAMVCLLIGGGMFLVIWFRESCKEPDYHPRGSNISLDIYETAYLTGGESHTIRTAIATLVKREYLQPKPATQTFKIIGSLPNNSHPLERAIASALQRYTRFEIKKIAAEVAGFTHEIHARLRRQHLLVNPEQMRFTPLHRLPILQILGTVWRFALTFLCLLCIGVMLFVLWTNANHGFVALVLFLPLFVFSIVSVATVIGFLNYLFGPLHRTKYGNRVLADLQIRYTNLRAQSLNSDSQVGLAFAIFGMAILTKNRLQGLGQILKSPAHSAGLSFGGSGG